MNYDRITTGTVSEDSIDLMGYKGHKLTLVDRKRWRAEKMRMKLRN